MGADKETARARIDFVGRLILRRLSAGPPVTLEEIAQLRFLAESDAEREMPVEELARVVLMRERQRLGLPAPETQNQARRMNLN